MARYRTTVQSPASTHDVFAYLADFATVAQWDPGVRSARLVSGAPGTTGARYLVEVGFLFRTIPLEYRVVESSPDQGRVVLEAQNADFRSYDVITVEPTAEGCAVTYDADLALKGYRRPFDPLLRAAFAVIGERARRGLAEAVLLKQPA